jgi:(p)ppGpp synthase/HD superfamily hydrolase
LNRGSRVPTCKTFPINRRSSAARRFPGTAPPAIAGGQRLTNTTLLLTRAFDFAARQHVDQRRKGVRAEPYLNHLAEVARLLAEASEGADPALVAAGILHDTIEDTPAAHEDLEAVFGAEIAALVVEVTDDKREPKGARKERQVREAPTKSPRAKMIKLADKTSNLRGLAASPPADWALAERREYLAWSARVAEGLRGENAHLESLFEEAFRTAQRQLGAVA